eukprot:15460303-Alexandrium_andersonii.AAC.1
MRTVRVQMLSAGQIAAGAELNKARAAQRGPVLSHGCFSIVTSGSSRQSLRVRERLFQLVRGLMYVCAFPARRIGCSAWSSLSAARRMASRSPTRSPGSSFIYVHRGG